MPESLAGRQVLIAGASSGLGSATSELLAGEGASLVLGYRTRREFADSWANRATVVQADLRVAQQRARLLDAAPSLYGLAVFTGDPARVAAPDEFETAARESMETNFLGPVALAREASDRMRAAGTPGAIVLLGTMQAVALFPNSTAYAAAKAALVHSARILAKEVRGDGIRVNVICPGVNDAGMAKASIASGKYNRYLEERIVTRFGRAGDVARAVRFLLEPDSYITGQVLTVDGGLTL